MARISCVGVTFDYDNILHVKNNDEFQKAGGEVAMKDN